MRFLYRDKRKNQLANGGAVGSGSKANLEHQRHQARTKMALYCLSDRIRIFSPMMGRVMRQFESKVGLVVFYPNSVTLQHWRNTSYS